MPSTVAKIKIVFRIFLSKTPLTKQAKKWWKFAILSEVLYKNNKFLISFQKQIGDHSSVTVQDYLSNFINCWFKVILKSFETSPISVISFTLVLINHAIEVVFVFSSNVYNLLSTDKSKRWRKFYLSLLDAINDRSWLAYLVVQ